MNKNKFSTLIKELHAGLIAFIDDDFNPKKDFEEILFHIISLNEIDFKLLKEKLAAINPEIVGPIESFRIQYLKITFTQEDKEYIDSQLIVEILKHKKEKELQEKAESIIETLKSHEDDISSLIMNFGLIAVEGGTTCYKPFFDAINGDSEQKSIRVYKSLEGEKFNEFEKDIITVLDSSDYKYCLLIVDKKLSNQQDGNNIIEELRSRKNVNSFFSVLFTSDPGVVNQPNEIQHYFHFEIPKPSDPNQAENALDQVSANLALCAYATFFTKLYELKTTALSEANKLVLQSGKENILYLADMAHAEGATAFRTIDNWLELLIQKKLNDRLSRKKGDTLDFDFVIGLTSLINSNYFPDTAESITPEFKKEVESLSSFELFNDSINNIYSPPTPGDIYMVKNDLYILCGQDCDLIVRDDGDGISRKERLAEVVKCNFIPKQLDVKKHEDDKSLSLNYFFHNGKYGNIQLEYNKRSFIDFRILDLCSLNDLGESNFKKDLALNRSAKNSLPKMWEKYLKKLVPELEQKVKIIKYIQAENIDNAVLSSDISFSLSIEESEGGIKFPVKRISRLKGQFKEYFLQRYWEYKTRKGLNTISLYNRKSILIDSVQYGFKGALTDANNKIEAFVQLTGNREKNKSIGKLPLIVSKSSLLSIINDPHKSVFEKIKVDEIIINSSSYTEQSTQTIFIKEYAAGKMNLKIHTSFFNEISESYFVPKEKLHLNEIFTDEFLATYTIGNDANYVVGDTTKPLFNAGNRIKLELSDFEEGVKLSFLDYTIKLNKEQGKISKVEIIE